MLLLCSNAQLNCFFFFSFFFFVCLFFGRDGYAVAVYERLRIAQLNFLFQRTHGASWRARHVVTVTTPGSRKRWRTERGANTTWMPSAWRENAS